MRALVFNPPGGVDELKYTADFPVLDKTSLRPDEVLIEVAAAGVIYPELSWPLHEAKDGSFPPRIMCPDYSGKIAATAPNVSEFVVGDEVMAVSWDFDDATGVRKYQGGAAEFAIAPVSAVVKKPRNVSLESAASIPLCSWTAWQAFHDKAKGKAKPGAEILIVGAGGATGLWAVQVAKLTGARITVTASDPEGIKILQDLGVDEVINYRHQDLVACGRKFDVVLDVVGGQTFKQCAQVVKPAAQGGLLISLVEYEAETQVPEDVTGLFFIWEPNKDHMAEIVALIEEGQLKPIVDSVYRLEDGREAFLHAARGHSHGKIILSV